MPRSAWPYLNATQPEGFHGRNGNLYMRGQTPGKEHTGVDCDASVARETGVAEDSPSHGAVTSDQGLARRIAGGDTQAWDDFFDTYFPWAYRFAYRHLGGNRADAEDLCSDILMTAARCIRRFDPSRGTLDLWLLGIARHRLARFCRKRRTECPLVLDATEAPNNLETSIPAEALDAAFTREAVNRALASLPQRQAAVLVGKYVAGYTVEELARTQGVTSKAVESLLSRGRASFRHAFAKLRDSVSGGGYRG